MLQSPPDPRMARAAALRTEVSSLLLARRCNLEASDTSADHRDVSTVRRVRLLFLPASEVGKENSMNEIGKLQQRNVKFDIPRHKLYVACT